MSATRRALALNDAQLQMVRQASAKLKPRVRPLFLQLVASELSDAGSIDDDAIRAVINLVFAADKVMEKSHA